MAGPNSGMRQGACGTFDLSLRITSRELRRCDGFRIRRPARAVNDRPPQHPVSAGEVVGVHVLDELLELLDDLLGPRPVGVVVDGVGDLVEYGLLGVDR